MVGTGDIIAQDLRVLFVAINPSPSAANGRTPFATATNGFWPLLHAAGLTPRLLLASEADLLLDEGLGLVSMVQRSTPAASELRAKELRAGAKRLARIVDRWHPRNIALLGVTLLPFVLPQHDEPGPGLKTACFYGARVFVLPNPSGRNLSFPGIAGKLPWYRALASLL
jgi:TDG/mug DNA glycosylase family protein